MLNLKKTNLTLTTLTLSELYFAGVQHNNKLQGLLDAGGSLEFSVGVGLNVTVGEGFFVEGTIGDIPADHFSGDKLYRAGLYAYPHQSQGGQSFMVVNYWVEK